MQIGVLVQQTFLGGKNILLVNLNLNGQIRSTPENISLVNLNAKKKETLIKRWMNEEVSPDKLWTVWQKLTLPLSKFCIHTNWDNHNRHGKQSVWIFLEIHLARLWCLQNKTKKKRKKKEDFGNQLVDKMTELRWLPGTFQRALSLEINPIMLATYSLTLCFCNRFSCLIFFNKITEDPLFHSVIKN